MFFQFRRPCSAGIDNRDASFYIVSGAIFFTEKNRNDCGGLGMKVLVFGSLNIDCVFRLPRIARAGETVASSAFSRNVGGKGLNQAVALGRAGAEVYMAGAVGEDGAFLRAFLEASGVRTELIRTLDVPSGQAMIQVEDSGENAIVLYPGANRALPPEAAAQTLSRFSAGDWLLLQNEINLTPALIEEAHRRGMVTVLNPSPFTPEILSWPLEKLQWLILNELEGADMTGRRDPDGILDALRSRLPRCGLVLTLGEAGSVCDTGAERLRQPACPVRELTDTTGAGDTFTGYFVQSLLAGETAASALRAASRAAAVAISRPGAAVSVPTRREVEESPEV